jgi:hypothetical protein
LQARDNPLKKLTVVGKSMSTCRDWQEKSQFDFLRLA